MSGQPELGATIFLTGPPGAGKTTTALLWSVQRERPTWVFDIDQTCGAIEFADELEGRPPMDVDQRYALAARVIAASVARSTAIGVDCVVAAPRLPAHPSHPPSWSHLWDDLDRHNPVTIVLLPRASVCVQRNLADLARRTWVDEDSILQSYAFGWEHWRDEPRTAVIDTSAMTPDEVATAVEAAVAEVNANERIANG